MIVAPLQNVLIRHFRFQGLIFLFLIVTGSNGFAQNPYLIASFQDGTNGYSGTRDTKLLSGSPNTNYGSVTRLEVDGSPDKSALLFWDVTNVPIGSIIQSVDITVNVTNTSGSSTYEIYDLKRAWIESEATWYMYASGQNWDIAGADGAGDRGLTALGAIVGSSLGSTTVSLNATGVAAVQSWVDDPSSNHGFIVQDYINHSNGLDFSSREDNPASSRPSLTITYLPPYISSITVLTPNGGEQWEVGSTQTITWNSTGDPAAVDIEYSIDNGGSWQLIVANTADDGSEPWLIPNTPSNMVLIRITSTDGSLSDQSDEVFTINIPPSPSLMIDDVMLTEGDGGTTDAVFTVTLTPSSAQTVTVDYNTEDGTALSGSDYVYVAGQLIFSLGEANKPITVPIYGDILEEGVESFFINLSNASDAIIGDGQGIGTIIDNDGIGIRFANIGDYGDAGQEEQDVSALIGSWNVDFILTNGDNNYPDGDNLTIDDNIGQYYRDYIDNYQGSYLGNDPSINRFFPSLGNHDWNTVSGNPSLPYPYLDYFTLPGNGILTTGTSGNERYYDFIIGPVHFFAIDSDSQEPDGRTSASTQGQWLQAQLAASTSNWNVVFMHHAPYSSSSNHGSQAVMQWPYEAWGADVVFAGHDHTYERILKDDNNDGVVMPYFVNGLGGRSRYSFGTPIPGSHVRFSDDYGAMLIEADADSMTFQFYSRTGQIIDSYKLPSGPTLTITSPNGGETWPGGSVQNITWSSFATSGMVRIEYSVDNGLSWSDVAASTVDDGTEPWSVPATFTSQALVRVSDTDVEGPADQSDATFSIIAAGVTITESGGSTDVAEGGATDTYDISLNSVPLGTVEITVSADAQTEVSENSTDFFNSLVLNFTDQTPQAVTVRAIDDVVVEGAHTSTISHAVTGTINDPNYPAALVINDVTANITDNDAAGVTITESGGSTDVAEGGATDTYDISLNSVPLGSVEITVSADAQTEVSENGTDFFNSLVLSFTDQTPQTVRVRAIDDVVVEGAHTSIISHAVTGTINDPNYPAALVINDVTANITDNEVIAGVRYQETQAGQASNSATVATSSVLTAASGDFYIAAIAGSGSISVNSISGLGLSWTLLSAQCASGNSVGLEVWAGQGVPTQNGAVTATFAGTPDNSVIAVSRYSNVDLADPVSGVLSGNPAGLNGACNSNSKSSSYSFDLNTTIDGSTVYGAAAATKNGQHNPGVNFTERAEVSQGRGKSETSVAVQDKMVTLASLTTIEGSFDKTVEWAVIGLAINPASATLMAAGDPTPPSMSKKHSDDTKDKIHNENELEVSNTEARTSHAQPIPQEIALMSNYPNPFNPETTVAYAIPADTQVRIIIYNSMGQQVRLLADEFQQAGYKTEVWNGKDDRANSVGSGIYFVQLLVDNKKFIKKIVFMK